MYINVNAKALSQALAIIRKGATIKSGGNWLESSAHKYGTDHVLIRVVDGHCTLYSASGTFDDNARCTFVRLDCYCEQDGTFAVPVRVLHDYAKTFGAKDDLTITMGERNHLIVTQGRNRASIVGNTLENLSWLSESLQFGQTTTPARSKVSYNMSDATGRALAAKAAVIEEPATDVMHGPAYVAPLCDPPGYSILSTIRGKRALAAAWRDKVDSARAFAAFSAHLDDVNSIEGQYCDWSPAPTLAPIVADESDADVNAIIEAITGEQYAQDDPTPIYAPAVGTFVHLMYRHSDGRTTERVVNVKSTLHMPEYFRGYDVRYGKMRNYHTASIVWMREWDRQAICDMQGKEVVPAYAA